MDRVKKVLKRIGQIIGILVLILVILCIIGVIFAPDYTKKKTLAGFPVNSSLYINLDKKTNIWISVWLPEKLAKGEKLPGLIETGRYAEQLEMGWLGKVMQVYLGAKDLNFSKAKRTLDKGYAFIWIQSPGSCQSSGPRAMEYPPDEVEAIGRVIDWIIEQPWSNGKVGAIGGSYSGTTADRSGAAMRPALKVIASDAPDFDPYQVNAQPGGIMSRDFIKAWAGMINCMDRNDMIGMVEADGEKLSFLEKLMFKSTVKGLSKPKHSDISIFNQAISDHETNMRAEDFSTILEFKDNKAPGSNISLGDIALYNYKNEIEKASVSTHTRCGWMDSGVAEGVLQRFLTINSPQTIVIGPSGHIVTNYYDPFQENQIYSKLQLDSIQRAYYEFVDQCMKTDSPLRSRSIRYFTYGTGQWRETGCWPPEGMTNQDWYLSESNKLKPQAPENADGADTYQVDFTATTGAANRWMTQMGKPVSYPDRKEEDEKLLIYNSEPLAKDLEVTGSPTVTLYVASTHSDCAFHVYLEDVAPGGKVTYLTEGILRAIHRKCLDPTLAPYVPLGVYHSFNKTDTISMVPGEIAEIRMTLYPVSAVFKAGHSIRIAIAGHDASMQSRYPENGTPKLKFERNHLYLSRIQLPVIGGK